MSFAKKEEEDRVTAPVVPYAPAPRRPSKTPSTAVFFSKHKRAKRKPCSICTLLGAPNPDRHEVEDCWANPHSEEFKEEVYKKRVLEALYKGVHIPQFHPNYDP